MQCSDLHPLTLLVSSRLVSSAQYKEFYRFIANAYDEPKYRLHFRTDAPIDLKCLFYVPR